MLESRTGLRDCKLMLGTSDTAQHCIGAAWTKPIGDPGPRPRRCASVISLAGFAQLLFYNYPVDSIDSMTCENLPKNTPNHYIATFGKKICGALASMHVHAIGTFFGRMEAHCTCACLYTKFLPISRSTRKEKQEVSFQ